MQSPVYLNALRAFEASARHRSFSAAAAELHVTPAAVGQLVRSLEDWLGTPLFHRGKGPAGLLPTEAAERALPDIRAGFERLSSGLERLREGTASGMLTITVSPAFAAKWLLPRIDSFQAAWPDTDVRLDTSLKPVDLAAQGVDIGVRYGAGQWPGLVAEKLMDEEVYPVCAPGRHKRLRSAGDLAGETLIHDLSMDERQGFTSWTAWLRNAGADTALARRGMRINNSAAVLQAAIEGRGIALARSILARDDLAAGRLVRLFPSLQHPSSLAYYVVYRAEGLKAPKVVAFRAWLLGEASKASA